METEKKWISPEEKALREIEKAVQGVGGTAPDWNLVNALGKVRGILACWRAVTEKEKEEAR